MIAEHLENLRNYRKMRWGLRALSSWTSLCELLGEYQPPCRSLAINQERKWELVSAFQKTIRRGDKQMALRLISAIDSMPAEYAYFWRRLCVIACEDIGPASDTLTAFVVTCNAVFPPKKTGSKNYDLFCFLAEQMCGLSTRSRIYCSYGVIEEAASGSSLPELSVEDVPIISAIMKRKAAVQAPESPWQEWQKKNDWRAGRLLTFLGLTLPVEMVTVRTPVPPYVMLFGLPSYSYDMYTRVGLEVLRRFIKGVSGAESIRDFFRENKVKGAHRALGEALFFEEGGRIRGELIYAPLSDLEQRLFAHQFELTFSEWMRLRILVKSALADGLIDQVREEVLGRFYADRNCTQLQRQMTLPL
jgi:hypothetical protein